jgi:hypothetical protein
MDGKKHPGLKRPSGHVGFLGHGSRLELRNIPDQGGSVTPTPTRRSSFYYEAVGIAVQSILAHKLRTLLTLTGIIIGVASVVLVGAAISGMNSYVVQRVAKILGINHFMVARITHTKKLTDEK